LKSGDNRQMVAPAMRARPIHTRPAQPRRPRNLRLALRLAFAAPLPLALAACGGGTRLASNPSYSRHYTAPGPPSDPWGPYIHEASARFTVPQTWIRAVMRQESGGHEYLNGRLVTSDAGAMGLMQLMPATYAELADRYGLGNDPYEPHDNIMAGTGYISELYARYGSPAFLAAYNAGPHRLDQYNAGQARLPDETVAYIASIAPSLEGPQTGPLAAYAYGRSPRAPVQVYAASAHTLGGCWRDPDAAYDPDDPCNRHSAPASAPVVVAARAGVTTTRAGGMVWADGASALSPPPPAPPSQAPVPSPSYAVSANGCVRDLDAAYDPQHPCNGTARQAPVMLAAAPPVPPPSAPAWGSRPAAAPPLVRVAATKPAHRFALIATAQAEPVPVSAAGAGWGVQVGAFASADYARLVAQAAQRVATEYLAPARLVLGRGGQALFQARLIGVSQPSATKACAKLNAHRWDCLTVPPGG
jgi:soluble lytic murein transglycosylase-like protein